jgi:hypothetical protein
MKYIIRNEGRMRGREFGERRKYTMIDYRNKRGENELH